jgi:hypothetical protein
MYRKGGFMKNPLSKLANFWKTAKHGKLVIIIATTVILSCTCCVGTLIWGGQISKDPAYQATATNEAAITQTHRSIPTVTDTPIPTSFPTNTATISPTRSTMELTEDLLLSVLGEGNRDMPRLTSVEWHETEAELYIVWALDDNLTAEYILRGGMIDIRDMLKEIDLVGIPYSYQSILFDGTFSMVDIYGNAEESRVILATYTRESIDLINWENFITDNIPVIAATWYQHPAFTK